MVDSLLNSTLADNYFSKSVISVCRGYQVSCTYCQVSLYLQVTRACIKSRTSLNFGQIGSLTTELAALERLKNFTIDLKWENAVSMLARSFLIKSSSKLLVIRTGMKARTSLISGGIRLLTLELLAFEWWKFYTFELEYISLRPVGQYWSNSMSSINGGGERCIMFWGRLDQNSGFRGSRKPKLTYNGENGVSTFSWLLLIRCYLYLQVTRTCIKSRTSSNLRQIGPLTTELAAFELLKNFP